MARAATRNAKIGLTIAAWLVALLLFFPILWTMLTRFKTEAEAIASRPPFCPRSGRWRTSATCRRAPTISATSSIRCWISVGSTLIGLLIGIPAAWSMAFSPTKRTKDILMWMLSTKMMPAVGVARADLPDVQQHAACSTRVHGLTMVMTLINLPIIIWMLYTYFKEIPVDILEAARMDGAELWNEIIYVLVPMAVPGIASTLLLNVILAWNEAFWTINLTAANAGR